MPHKLQIIADLDQKQLAWLGNKKTVRAIDLRQGWEYVTKKTKEDFQELEIWSSKL